jgi:hypothetical protein
MPDRGMFLMRLDAFKKTVSLDSGQLLVDFATTSMHKWVMHAANESLKPGTSHWQ